QVKGPLIPVLDGVQGARGPFGLFSVSASGTLAYVSGSAASAGRTIVWVDRDGKEQPLAQPARLYNNPRISPDGRRAVFSISGEMEDIWIYDFIRGTMQRVTAEGNSGTPVWATNTRLIYERRPLAGPAVMSIALDGNGAPSVLARAEKNPIAPSAVSADGKNAIGFYPFDHGLWVLSLTENVSSEGKAQPFLDTRFTRFNPDFSPDGQWVAFRGDDTGRSEIYVAPYPGHGAKIPISNDGGSLPRWSRTGR